MAGMATAAARATRKKPIPAICLQAMHRLAQLQPAPRTSWQDRHPRRAADEAGLAEANQQALDDFGRKTHGTYQTHAHAATIRQGALARLYQSGAISIDQLAAGASIQHIHAVITRDVTIGTLSLETRVDVSRSGDGAFFEKLGTVRSEVAYSAWRRELKHPALVLAVIVDDLSLSAAARAFRVRKASVRPILTDALDLWDEMIGRAVDDIDEATLLAAQAGILS
jgi:hypothetical protein